MNCDDRDPIEFLRAHDPIRNEPAPPPVDQDPVAQRILARVLAADPEPAAARRRWSRPRLVAAIVAALAALAAGTAAAVLLRGSPDPTGVACFAEADLAANRAKVELGGDAVAACVSAWNDQGLEEVLPGPAPQLEACRLASGLVGVFPSAGAACAELGLEPAGPEPPQSAVVTSIRDRVDPLFVDGCADLDDLHTEVAAAFQDLGVDDWTVELTPGGPGLCGSIDVDPTERVVRLFPIPPPPPSAG